MEDDFYIQEFNPDLIAPSNTNYTNFDQGGSKIVIIGKPNTGKSTLVKYLISTKRMIPFGIVMNSTEESTNFYSKMFPPLFVYNKYNEKVLVNLQTRQLEAKKHISNPWSMLILDDCTDEKDVFKSQIQTGLYKNGRHWKLLYIVVLQYSVDLPPSLRTCVDGVFIFKETNEKNLKKIYENYAGVFPTFQDFRFYMSKITGDFTALYIDSQNQAMKSWKDCIYYIKAPMVDDFKFGCKEYRAYAKDRVDRKFLEDPHAKMKLMNDAIVKSLNLNSDKTS